MSLDTVLLTGGGGVAIPTLINRLRKRQYRVVVVDADLNAPGLYLADQGYRIPLARDPLFSDTIRRICRKENVSAIVPLVDEELLPLANLASQENIVLMAPQDHFIALCLDKFLLMKRLTKAGLPVPFTKLLSDREKEVAFPVIVKPRTGRGSRGIFVATSPDDLKKYNAENHPEPEKTLVQSYIQGPEYTVSVVLWRDGMVRAVVPKKLIDKRGVTRIAITQRIEIIDSICKDIQNLLSAYGPFNVQLRIDSTDGIPRIFEINPRFSTTITLTQAAGVDELSNLLDLALGRTNQCHEWAWREGITVLRRTEDEYFEATEFMDRRNKLEDGTW